MDHRSRTSGSHAHARPPRAPRPRFAVALLGGGLVVGLCATPTTTTRAAGEPGPGAPTAGDGASAPARPSDGHDRSAASDEPGGGRGRGNGGPRSRGITQAERDETLAFLKEHSPERYAAIDELPDGQPRNRMIYFAASEYLRWRQTKVDDPALYDVIVRRVEAEDHVFKLVSQLQSLPADKQADVRSQLQARVGELVDIGFAERQLRLAQLTRTLKSEQDKLASDQARRDDVVKDVLDKVLSDGQRLFPPPPGGPDGGGPGGPGPGGPGGPGGPAGPGGPNPGGGDGGPPPP